MSQDPDELHDVSKEQPELRASFRSALLERLAKLSERGGLDVDSSPIPEDLRERLRALGYVQ